jgi:hypothetical protein
MVGGHDFLYVPTRVYPQDCSEMLRGSTGITSTTPLTYPARGDDCELRRKVVSRFLPGSTHQTPLSISVAMALFRIRWPSVRLLR